MSTFHTLMVTGTELNLLQNIYFLIIIVSLCVLLQITGSKRHRDGRGCKGSLKSSLTSSFSLGWQNHGGPERQVPSR